MTLHQRIVSVLSTLKYQQARMEYWGISHAEGDEQIRQIEEDMPEYAEGSPEDSPLVALVKAYEQVQRIEAYLFRTTYAQQGVEDKRCWLDWYEDVAYTVGILRESEQALRVEIAQRLGATV
jgi:hypothetical protein